MALFGFLGGKKTTVGLDIGSGIIKVAVIDHSGSEAELVKVATTEVAADAIVEGEVMDPGIVAEAIRGLFSAAGVKQKSVVTAVGGRAALVKKSQGDRVEGGGAPGGDRVGGGGDRASDIAPLGLGILSLRTHP